MNSTMHAPLFSRGTRMLVRAALPFALGLAVVAPLHAQKIATIAHYTFSDPANLFKDSSTNSFNLSGTGVAGSATQSLTEYSELASTTQSVYFNGAQTGSANRQINFSSYTALTFDWHMKVDPADLNPASSGITRTLFQTGYQADVSGGFGIQLRWNTPNNSASIYVYHRLQGSAKWAFITFLVDDINSWSNYALTIDNSVSGLDHVVLSVDGIARTALPGSTYSDGATGAAFPADQFSYFANSAGKTTPFKGYLQDFEIYSGTQIPEPKSAGVLMGLIGVVVVMGFRRRR